MATQRESDPELKEILKSKKKDLLKANSRKQKTGLFELKKYPMITKLFNQQCQYLKKSFTLIEN